MRSGIAAARPLTAQAQQSRAARWLQRFVSVDRLAVVIVALSLGLRLWQFPNPVSGGDGGNWLALSAELLGPKVRAASSVYPPLFLVVTLVLQAFLPALEALRIAAVATSVAPGVATFCLLRAAGVGPYALLGLAFTFAGYGSEMLAWGAYPQLLGTAFVLGSLAALAYAARSRATAHLILAALLAGLAILTNQLAGLQAMAALAVAYAVWALSSHIPWRQFLRGVVVLAAVSAAITLPAVPTYLTLITRTGPGAFNAQEIMDLEAAVTYVVNEAPSLWALLFAAILPAMVLLVRRRDWTVAGAFCGLLVASVGLAAITREVRFLYLAQAAALLGFTIVLQAAAPPDLSRVLKLATAAVAVALITSVAFSGYRRLERSLAFYGYLDPFVVDGLSWLREHARPGDLAASAAVSRGWPTGWWIEGLARVPTYIESDPRWLAFHEEKQHAAIASEIFAETDPQLALLRARQERVTLLVIDVRHNRAADRWLATGRVNGPLGVVYQNPSLVIFRVAPS